MPLLLSVLKISYKHSALKSSNDQGMQPHISVRKENDKIIIKAGNPVPNDAKDKLVRRLDHINKLDEAALKAIYENRINHDPKK